jgi:hypothetical protein
MADNQDDSALEELNADSTGSGLEAERAEEDSLQAPFDPKLIDVVTHQRTVDLLMSRLEHSEMDLSPDFQRRANLWTLAQKSGLLESLLLRIPIPSLYVSEDEDGRYQVVDGLQRICAIAHFVQVSALNKALSTSTEPLRLNPLRLTKLQELRELEGRSFDELARPLQRRIRETELTLHVIRAGTPNNVKFNIFSRINKGGLPLTAQEIRNAIYPGEWRGVVRRMVACDEFLSATEGRIKAERQEDLELMLRFAALYSLQGQKRTADENLDDFLNKFVDKDSVAWAPEKWAAIEFVFKKAMKWAPKVFGRIAFRKYSGEGESRRPINRGLFETEAVILARRSERDLEILSEKSTTLLTAFGKRFRDDSDFAGALLYATGRGAASNKRIEVFESLFEETLSA